MLDAVIKDLLAHPKVSVATTWDKRLASSPLQPLAQCDVQIVDSPLAERDAFIRQLAIADAALIIAPETDRILEQRVASVLKAGVPALNATPDGIALCRDKLALARFCSDCDVATPTTCLLDESFRETFAARYRSSGTDHWVIKPRDGAGSQATALWTSADLVAAIEADGLFVDEPNPVELIIQPFVPGRAVSCAALCDGGGRLISTLPIAAQRLSANGRFTYLGGEIDARDISGAAEGEAIIRMIDRLVTRIEGLRGYIGFDFVLPDDAPDDPVLIEINPRLTTSYAGYRAICSNGPLTRWMLPAQAGETRDKLVGVPRFQGRVRFSACGECDLG